ncbi:hypothetical protein FACS1894109_02980 [Spirochaetia bacterium]|nr:hypothetical protein FACS1894109_02980 [Spirochaetia bacterium]
MQTIVLVDDHVMIRWGGGCPGGGAAFAGKFRNRADLIILDIELGDDDGLEFIGTIKEQDGKIPAVLVYSVFEDPFRI